MCVLYRASERGFSVYLEPRDEKEKGMNEFTHESERGSNPYRFLDGHTNPTLSILLQGSNRTVYHPYHFE